MRPYVPYLELIPTSLPAHCCNKDIFLRHPVYVYVSVCVCVLSDLFVSCYEVCPNTCHTAENKMYCYPTKQFFGVGVALISTPCSNITLLFYVFSYSLFIFIIQNWSVRVRSGVFGDRLRVNYEPMGITLSG